MSSSNNIKLSSICDRIDRLTSYVLKLDNQMSNQTHKLDYIINQLNEINNNTNNPDNILHLSNLYRSPRNSISCNSHRNELCIQQPQPKLPRITKSNHRLKSRHQREISTSSSGSDYDANYLEMSPTNKYISKKSSRTKQMSRRSFDASFSAQRAPTLTNIKL
mgnify:CR=1 FL=1